jgi:immune inhibitor A
MIRSPWPLIGALLLTLITATCASPATSVSTLTSTYTPTLTFPSTHAPTLPPTHTPTLLPTPTSIPAHTLTLPPAHTPTPTPQPTHTPALLPTPTPVSSPTLDAGSTSQAIPASEPPPRPFDFTVLNPAPPRRVPNAVRSFWITDGTTGERREITARLRVQTEHAAMWVEEGVWHDVRTLQEAADVFETHIYSTARAAFGSEWIPGVDNDPRIHFLHATGLGEGILGYTTSADEFPRAHYPTSNEAEVITIHAGQVEVGSSVYYGLLARQFQRVIQWYQDRNEERWVKEGLAELAVRLNAFDLNSGPEPLRRSSYGEEQTERALGPLQFLSRPEQAYLERPDTSLVHWQDETPAPHRGAGYLFATYFHDRFGDAGTRVLVAQPLNGAAGFDAALVELGADLAFEDLFADWLVANYLDGEQGANNRYQSYTHLELERPALAAIYENYPVTMEASVQQFGADYILLRGDGDLSVRFDGMVATSLLDLSPHSEQSFWWSNRADESMTTLTRAFDLSSVEPVTMTYWTWYDIEPGYDYAFVEASTDGGKQWQPLSVPSGTADGPNGNNPGLGYTGQSGDPPGWIQEAVDLSPVAGGEVLIRFAYLTDEAITGVGVLLDDISIPAIGYADDAETGEGEWEPAGFVYSGNSVPQRYLVLLIGIGPGEGPENEVTVERLPVKEDGRAEWTIPLGSEGWREAVLVLSGLASLTTHPAPYQLTIEQRTVSSQ